jgi:hypothetical protein
MITTCGQCLTSYDANAWLGLAKIGIQLNRQGDPLEVRRCVCGISLSRNTTQAIAEIIAELKRTVEEHQELLSNLKIAIGGHNADGEI